MICLKKLASALAGPVAKIAQAVKTEPPRPRSLDPWLNDNIRKAEVNAAAARGDRRGWIPPRLGWLR